MAQGDPPAKQWADSNGNVVAEIRYDVANDELIVEQVGGTDIDFQQSDLSNIASVSTDRVSSYKHINGRDYDTVIGNLSADEFLFGDPSDLSTGTGGPISAPNASFDSLNAALPDGSDANNLLYLAGADMIASRSKLDGNRANQSANGDLTLVDGTDSKIALSKIKSSRRAGTKSLGGSVRPSWLFNKFADIGGEGLRASGDEPHAIGNTISDSGIEVQAPGITLPGGSKDSVAALNRVYNSSDVNLSLLPNATRGLLLGNHSEGASLAAIEAGEGTQAGRTLGNTAVSSKSGIVHNERPISVGDLSVGHDNMGILISDNGGVNPISGGAVLGAICLDNGQAGTNPYGIEVRGDVSDLHIAGCLLTDTRDPANKTQQYGIRIGSGASDINIGWNYLDGNATGKIDDQGTRTRFLGTIGGGPLGGVDLSSVNGQFEGDRAVADGSSAANAGDLARWDSANSEWQVFQPATTVQ